MGKRSFLIIFALWFSACGLAESSMLHTNLSGLFSRHGLRATKLKCWADLQNRSGSCGFAAKAGEIEKIGSSFGLEPIKDKEDNIGYNPLEQGKCNSLGFEWGKPSLIYLQSKAPVDLENGQAFERFILIYDPNIEEGCVEIQYSYG